MRYTTALCVVESSRIVTLWHSNQVPRNGLKNCALLGSHRHKNRPPVAIAVDDQTSYDQGADRIISHLVKIMLFYVNLQTRLNHQFWWIFVEKLLLLQELSKILIFWPLEFLFFLVKSENYLSYQSLLLPFPTSPKNLFRPFSSIALFDC